MNIDCKSYDDHHGLVDDTDHNDIKLECAEKKSDAEKSSEDVSKEPDVSVTAVGQGNVFIRNSNVPCSIINWVAQEH